jgi:hypothetical protein
MIRLNRIRSLKVVLHSSHFAKGDRNFYLSFLLGMAIIRKKNEACDLILSQGFEIDDDFIKPEDLWMNFTWTTEELDRLVSRHPQLVKHIAPTAELMAECKSADACLTMIDVSQKHPTGNGEGVAANPSKALEFVVGNPYLSDEAMAKVFKRLLGLGAVLSEETWTRFITDRASHVLTYKTLLAAPSFEFMKYYSSSYEAPVDLAHSRARYANQFVRYFLNGDDNPLTAQLSSTSDILAEDMILLLAENLRAKDRAKALNSFMAKHAFTLIDRKDLPSSLAGKKAWAKQHRMVKIVEVIEIFEAYLEDYWAYFSAREAGANSSNPEIVDFEGPVQDYVNGHPDSLLPFLEGEHTFRDHVAFEAIMALCARYNAKELGLQVAERFLKVILKSYISRRDVDMAAMIAWAKTYSHFKIVEMLEKLEEHLQKYGDSLGK